MSYCVNCGVKLDPSLSACPLCGTPVINPRLAANPAETPGVDPSYAAHTGTVDSAKSWEYTILALVVLGATALSCLLLNLLVFNGFLWSFIIIGACVLLFALLVPLIFKIHVPYYLCITFDGAATAFYLFLISRITPGSEWFGGLAVPIVVLATCLALAMGFFLHRVPPAVLTTAFALFALLAVFCCGVDLLIRRYTGAPLWLGWSAIVLTVCCVICITLALIIRRTRLREEVRRRLHF